PSLRRKGRPIRRWLERPGRVGSQDGRGRFEIRPSLGRRRPRRETMSRLSAAALAVVSFAAAAQGQHPFPLGPGPLPPQPIAHPSINEYICRSVVDHAMSATFTPITGSTVELVSSRWQGELVFVFSRVYWTRHEGWKHKPVTHMAEVQYSMIQR